MIFKIPIKTIITLFFLLNTQILFAGLLSTPADIITVGGGVKGWLGSRGNNKENIHRMFYHVDKKTSAHVLSQMNESNKKQICNNLNKAAIDFLNGAEIDKNRFYNDFYSEAKKQYKKNPSLPMIHYLFSELKFDRSSWFYLQLKGLILGAKIRNSDIENLEFHNIDVSKYELRNLFSLDNSFYAGNYSYKNSMRAILIDEAINLSAFYLLEKHCKSDRNKLIFLNKSEYNGLAWQERDPLSKLALTLPGALINAKKGTTEVNTRVPETHKAVDLSAIAYSRYELFKDKYKTSSNKVGTSEFNNVKFFAIEESTKVYIIFRGTASKYNAKTDLNIKHVNFMDIPGTKVHSGFYNIAKYSKEILKNLIQKDKSIIISGHSLGGGVGLLLGAMIKKEDINKDVSVYSYGAPPVGNKNFVNAIEGLQHFRYVHNKDIVPKINKSIADKYKKLISKVTKPQTFKRIKLPISITNIPYDFIHYGKQIELNNTPVRTTSNNAKIAFIKGLVNFDDAHSILTYVEGVKNR